MKLITLKAIERDGDNRPLPVVTTINTAAILTIGRAADERHWLVTLIGGDYVMIDDHQRSALLCRLEVEIV